MRFIILAFTILSLSACSQGNADYEVYEESEGEYSADDDTDNEEYANENEDSEEEEEQEDALSYDGEVISGESYSDYDQRRDNYGGSMGSYGGYGCTQDCSGHEAGYNWAMEKGITDPENCGGNSWSFIEGCRAYAEENQYDAY